MNNLLSNNPFRVLGILSNSRVRLIEKNVSRFNAYTKLGKKIESIYDFDNLNLKPVNRETSNVSKSQNSLLLDNNKIKFSLFWFTDENPFDSIALKHLSNGDSKKALSVWEKTTKNKKLSKTNFSNFFNLSTLLLLKNLDTSKVDSFSKTTQGVFEIKEAIKLKYELIDSAFFKEFKNKNAPNCNVNLKEFFSNSILDILNLNFKNLELVDLFKGLSEDVYNLLSSGVKKEPINNIQSKINSVSEIIRNEPKNSEGSITHPKGNELGSELIKSTVKDLKLLKEFVDKSDFQFQNICDNLSNAIIDCGVAYWNSHVENQSKSTRKSYQDYISSFKYALSISVTEKVKTRSKASINHVKEQINSNKCKICNVNDIANYSSIKINMHKMNWDNSYSYFKNGGIEISSCKSCSSSKSNKNIKAFFLGFLAWGAVSAVTMGWFLGIDIIFAQFKMSKWIFRKIKTEIYYNEFKNHPVIKPLLYEGYKFGMP